MEFAFTPAQEALRQDVRHFIAENLTEDVLEEIKGDSLEEGQRGPKVKELYKKIGEKGWIGISWPEKYGGQGGTRIDQYVVEEEFARVGLSVGGAGSGAPAIMAAGTEEQKNYFLPKIINGEVVLALGFTEPRGGADLAALECKAVRDGDDYVINGQKTFCTSAHYATHIYLMVRTDPEAYRHRGVSILLVPIDTPGITIQALWTLQNDPPAPVGTTYATPRTNHVFFDNVRAPISCLLGEENRGWYVGAMGLNLDRVGASRYLISVRRDEDIINWIKHNSLDGYAPSRDPAIRDRLAELWIEAQVSRLMTMRSMSMVERDMPFKYEGSAEKVWSPEHGVKTTETVTQILGPYIQLMNGSEEAIERGVFAHNLLGAWVSANNHGGVQIMRDQVVRRGFGFPRGY